MGRMPDMDLSDDDRPTPNRRSESASPRRAPRPRGWRQVLSGDWWASVGRTAAWLVPLTVLIWVYAEREQVVYPPVPNANVPLRVTTTATNRYVELAGPTPPAMVQLKLSGPQEQVDRVRNELSTQGLNLDLEGRGTGNGQQVNIVDAAQNLPLFRTAGVTVMEAQPSDVTVNIDNVVEREAIVEIDPDHRGNVSGTPTFSPARVTVRGPTTELDDLERIEVERAGKPADGTLRAYADLSNFDLRQPGERPLTDVPLTLPGHEPHVQVQPAQVEAKLRVRPADVSYDINPVPIIVDASPLVWHDFDVKVNDTDDTSMPHVHVIGPADKVDELKPLNGQPPRATVTAHLEVQREDFTGSGHEVTRRPVYWGLPDGVKVTPEDMDRTVTFKMSRRESSANP